MARRSIVFIVGSNPEGAQLVFLYFSTIYIYLYVVNRTENDYKKYLCISLILLEQRKLSI